MCAPQSRHSSDEIEERMLSHQKWKKYCRASENFYSELVGDLRQNDSQMEEFPHLNESATVT
jgi:hypothetical protein